MNFLHRTMRSLVMGINNCVTCLTSQKKQALTRKEKLFAICFDFQRSGYLNEDMRREMNRRMQVQRTFALHAGGLVEPL
jgi:hypothetical protein